MAHQSILVIRLARSSNRSVSPRDHAKRFAVRADEELTAFLELEAAIHG